MKTKLVWNKEKSQCERVMIPDNKIKIIDLLNMIANGEDLPKKIKYCGTIYEKFDYNNKYYDIDRNTRDSDILSEHLASESFYNDEIEIIEETEDSPTISEEQALFNKLNHKDQEYILNFMRMLQPCEKVSDNNEH